MSDQSGNNAITFPFVTTLQVLVLCTVLPIVCINVVALRFFTRLRRKVALGLDDWLIIPGLTLYVAMCICIIIGAQNETMGHDVPDEKTSPSPLQSFLIPRNQLFAKLLFSFQLMLTLSYGFVKCSIITLYRRIFVVERNGLFDIACKISYVLVIGWSTTFFLLTVLSCGTDPIAFWESVSTQSAQCKMAFSASQGLAASDLLLDIWLVILPQPLIWRLQLSVSKRLMVSVIIALGCSCVGTSIARMVLFGQIQMAANLDIPLDQNQLVKLDIYYSTIDGGVAVIAACLPCLRALFQGFSVTNMVRGVKSSFGASNAGSRGSHSWSKSKGQGMESPKMKYSRATDVERGTQT